MDTNKDIGHQWASDFSVVPAEVEAEFDAEAAAYEDNVQSWGYRSAVDGPKFLAEYIDTSATVLDAGCGTGLVGEELQRLHFSRVYGCDLSGAMLDIARDKDLYVELKRANLCERLPYDDDSFDAVACLATLGFIEEAELTFREFCRVTRTDGIVLFSQRCDLAAARNYASLLSKLESEGLWGRECHSEPQLYLPNHAAYTDQLQVEYFVYRVSGQQSDSGEQHG